MQRFLGKIALFVVIVGALILLYHRGATFLLTHYNGPNTTTKISESFTQLNQQKPDLVFLGNSRIYRGINPDKFSANRAYNMAHDHDSFNQMFYKLRYIQHHKIPVKTLVVGLDYFQFSVFSSRRNYAYAPYLDSDYLADYPYTFLPTQPYENLQGITMTATVLDMWRKYRDSIPNNPLVLKANGQLPVKGVAPETHATVKPRNAYRHPLQEVYFIQLLKLAQSLNIRTVVLIPPSREQELATYPNGMVERYNNGLTKITNQYKAHLLNYTADTSFHYFHYSDITHLNPEGADLFSTFVNDTLQHLAYP